MVILFTVNPINAQDKVFEGNPDTAFKVARELAFNGKRAQAQDSLRFILTKYPNYLDIRAFLASTYSWDGNYVKARKEFSRVLESNNKRKTDWIAYIKNEQYAEKYYKALELSNKSLSIFPGDPDLLQLKAKSELNRGNRTEALTTINEALKLHPNNQGVLDYKRSLETSLQFNTIGINYSMDIYDKNDRDNMYYSTLSYSRQTKYGSINTKVNYSNRFQTDNYQLEIDLYPKITKGLYAYVSGGWSESSLNPSQRYGFELFKSLPKSFEASLGFRWLKFSSETTIYTGSLGWYTGNSYWAFRTYITPGSPGTSKSGTLIYRKYRSDAENYFTVEAGLGASPALDRFIPGFTGKEVFDLDSQKLVVGYYFSTKNKKNAWGFNASVFREEKPFAKGEYFLYTSVGISYAVKFK
ncbi:YaiO family outer membrane beta-barrel protein [Polaribacter ponticola]|uniref:YaiO family outer membrane beta-barrel protein n=1 Tax=Polaribacter ponticola TaxID=2978475 RepID=A0ABT5S8Q2_9FLAO|nr:YaiO family outer membrane beta-barrel protein [Polaribacter sp. MSW5]MDD7914480.1 YaiO family outer membrane beta-barrel protein [Polaribacter sp. MSW5]